MASSDVVFTTSLGEITVRLNAAQAPVTTANFLQYVAEGHYDGTIFHRVIDGFMVQCGLTPDLSKKATREPIQLESKNGLKNLRGTLAMARTSAPNSATAQFFINVADNAFLDHGPGNEGYAVFGEVTAGMEVVDKIKAVPTGRKSGHDDVPLDDVVIESARVAP